MKHCVLWSGGFDSTAVLLNLIDQLEPKLERTAIELICIELANNVLQSNAEREARTSILQILSSHPKGSLFYLGVGVNTWDVRTFSTGWRSPQPIVWGSACVLATDFSDETTIHTGYRNGDLAYSVFPEFKSYIDAGCRLIGKPTPTVKNCEGWSDKEFIYAYCRFPGVFEKVSWIGDNETIKLEKRAEMYKLYEEVNGPFVEPNYQI